MSTTYEIRAGNAGNAVDVNLAGAVRRNARRFGDHVVVRYAGGDLTYADLDDRSARLATALRDDGVAQGDRVAYLGMNSTSFLVTMLAAARVGAIFVPLNYRLVATELAQCLQVSGAVCIVVEAGHRSLVDQVREGSTLTRFLLVDDDPEIPVPGAVPAGWQAWSAVTAAASPMTDVVAQGFDDPAMLMFTSGTTGSPKAVILTHGNIWWNAVNVDTVLDTRRGDVTHVVAPMFHIGALNSFLLRTLARGGTVVLRRAFDPAAFLRDLHEYGVNSFFAAPAMMIALSRVPAVFAEPLPDLRSIVVAAAPVPPSLIELFADHGIWLQQAWGLTETAPFATHLPREWTRRKAGSAGIPMPYTEVRVVDADNRVLPSGTPGEVVVRGPNVTAGYWRNAEATAAAFDDDGWFHSGDVGYLDEDDCLFIVDRLKDMIISGGENIYPAEVERALSDAPGVGDVAVVGTPDPEWGESVVAVVTLQPGATISLDDVRDHATATLARYKLPKHLAIVDQLPRNPSGKLEKVKIRGLVEEQLRDGTP